MTAAKRIGRVVRPYLQKAKDSALLAVEIYNKPAVKFRSGGFVALMVMAWTALLHAVFLRRGIKPFHKAGGGAYEMVDGDPRHWELAECARRHWINEPHNPIRANVELFIPLRNKIEHRHLPELDASIFGECQALLLNFDDLLGSQFGEAHRLRESLSFSLQLFPSGESMAKAVKANADLKAAVNFVENYRSLLPTSVSGSGQFAFKAFLIQVANHASKQALPIQFVSLDKLSAAEQAEFDKFAVMVKWKEADGVNHGLLKPSEVVAQVQSALGDPKIQRAGKAVNKFTLDTHGRFWRKHLVRPGTGASDPSATRREFCVFDSAHKDYLYKRAWVDFLVAKMKDDQEYEALFSSPR